MHPVLEQLSKVNIDALENRDPVYVQPRLESLPEVHAVRVALGTRKIGMREVQEAVHHYVYDHQGAVDPSTPSALAGLVAACVAVGSTVPAVRAIIQVAALLTDPKLSVATSLAITYLRMEVTPREPSTPRHITQNR